MNIQKRISSDKTLLPSVQCLNMTSGLYNDSAKMWTLQKDKDTFELYKNGLKIGKVTDIEKSNNEQCVKIFLGAQNTITLHLGKFDWRANGVAQRFKENLHTRTSFLLKWKEVKGIKVQTYSKTLRKPATCRLTGISCISDLVDDAADLTNDSPGTSITEQHNPFTVTCNLDDIEDAAIETDQTDKNKYSEQAKSTRQENTINATRNRSANENLGAKTGETSTSNDNLINIPCDFQEGIKKKFKGYYIINVEQLVEPTFDKLIRPADDKHVEDLRKEFKERPASYFTLMAVNLPGFKELPTDFSGLKFQTIGGNHSRIALQNIIKEKDLQNREDFLKRLCVVYCDLTPAEAKRVGMDHNTIHKLGKELNFFKRVECFRCTLFQIGGMDTRVAIDQERTPNQRDTVNKWKTELENITGVKSRKQLNNNFRFDIALAKLATPVWLEVKEFSKRMEEKTKKPVSKRQMKCLDGLKEEEILLTIKRANTEEAISFKEFGLMCKELKEKTNEKTSRKSDKTETEIMQIGENIMDEEDSETEEEGMTVNIDSEQLTEKSNLEKENRILKGKIKALENIAQGKEVQIEKMRKEIEDIRSENKVFMSESVENKRKMANMYAEIRKMRDVAQKRKHQETVTSMAEDDIVNSCVDLNPSPRKTLRIEESNTDTNTKNKQNAKSKEGTCMIKEYTVDQKIQAFWKEDNTWYDAIVRGEKKTGYATHVHKPDDHVILVYCVEMNEMVTNTEWFHSENGGDDAIDEFKSILNHEIKKVHSKLDEFRSWLTRLKLNGVVKSAQATKPGEGIIRVAKEENATMIVTGCRGLGKFRRTLLGSVSDYLVHHADIPVLVCRFKEMNK